MSTFDQKNSTATLAAASEQGERPPWGGGVGVEECVGGVWGVGG
jgi:hypothetical protein